MSDPSLTQSAGILAIGLGGCLLLARMLDKALPKSHGVIIEEDPDDVGYFAVPIAAIRGVPSDKLPRCPDVIPEWMMEEHYGRSR